MFLLKSTLSKSKPLLSRNFLTLSRLAPSQMYFTKNHEWVQFVEEGKPIAKVGISEYAADKLGDLSYTSLEEIHDELEDMDEIETGEDLVEVESVKASDTVKMPVTGKITTVNTGLFDKNAVIVNRDAHVEGWLVQIEVSDMSEIDGLMDKEAYEAFLNSDSE